MRRAEKTDDVRENTEQQAVCQVSMVRVRLVRGLRLLPNQRTLVEVELDDARAGQSSYGRWLIAV